MSVEVAEIRMECDKATLVVHIKDRIKELILASVSEKLKKNEDENNLEFKQQKENR